MPALMSMPMSILRRVMTPLKGSIDALEGFQFFEAANIGFCGLDDSAFSGEVAIGIVDFLFGYAVGFQQFGIARGSDFGEVHVGLSGDQIGAWPAESCWSTSGVSISARSSPLLTRLPMSRYHFFR